MTTIGPKLKIVIGRSEQSKKKYSNFSSFNIKECVGSGVEREVSGVEREVSGVEREVSGFELLIHISVFKIRILKSLPPKASQ
jgi:hypothetical protein